jgi:hypothetical protein
MKNKDTWEGFGEFVVWPLLIIIILVSVMFGVKSCSENLESTITVAGYNQTLKQCAKANDVFECELVPVPKTPTKEGK